jgi:ribonuclease HI
LRALAERLEGGGALSAEVTAALEAVLARCAAAGPPAAEPAAPAAEPIATPADPGAPIRVWTDGSCSPNPGPGGWGAILEVEGRREELSGAAPASTNNIMEMTGAIEALRRTAEGARVSVTTDSRYLKDGITQWIRNWKRNGWRKADGGPVLNQDLWRELDRLVSTRHVSWHWTASHAGHPENERCDELANRARRSLGRAD